MPAQHPAMVQIHKFLNTIVDKDLDAFGSFFDAEMSFANILPSGRRIESAHELVKERRSFFASPITSFEYGPLIDVVEDSQSFAAGTQAEAIRPDGNLLRLYMRLTFVLAPKTKRWVPRLIQNTLVEKD